MPVEGAIPQLDGIDICGDSIPAGTVGGDLFEYIDFQHRYDIEARIANALSSSSELRKPTLSALTGGDCVHDYLTWLRMRPEYRPELERAYREARGLESAYVAENLK